MRSQSCLIALALVVTAASPAFAQMRTSAPKGAAAAAPSTGGVATGDDQFRPTRILGVERAQVLADGNALMGLGGGLNLAMGMGNNIEVGGNAALNLALSPFNLGVPLGVYGKMLLPVNLLPNMTLALGANANLTLASTGSGFGAGVFLPITFWRLGPGNLHIVPGVGTTAGLGLGYELPLMPRWSLHIANNSVVTFGAAGGVSNGLSLGSRVGLTPNLTADVGSITFSGNNLAINLFSISGTFGGRMGDLRSAWGI